MLQSQSQQSLTYLGGYAGPLKRGKVCVFFKLTEDYKLKTQCTKCTKCTKYNIVLVYFNRRNAPDYLVPYENPQTGQDNIFAIFPNMCEKVKIDNGKKFFCFNRKCY